MSVVWKQSYNNLGNLHTRRVERGERRRDSSGIDEQMAVMVEINDKSDNRKHTGIRGEEV